MQQQYEGKIHGVAVTNRLFSLFFQTYRAYDHKRGRHQIPPASVQGQT